MTYSFKTLPNFLNLSKMQNWSSAFLLLINFSLMRYFLSAKLIFNYNILLPKCPILSFGKNFAKEDL